MSLDRDSTKNGRRALRGSVGGAGVCACAARARAGAAGAGGRAGVAGAQPTWQPKWIIGGRELTGLVIQEGVRAAAGEHTLGVAARLAERDQLHPQVKV